ncbi:putative SCAN domain-containing protein-like 7, partial [Homarus americanus]
VLCSHVPVLHFLQAAHTNIYIGVPASCHTDPTLRFCIIYPGQTVALDASPSSMISTFEPFCSPGSLALDQFSQPISVKLLRDTGSALSLVTKEAAPFLDSCYTGSWVLVNGLTGGSRIPLCQVYLRSSIKSGYVTLGVVDSLPVEGVSLLIGNDLVGDMMFPIVVISSCPTAENNTVQLEVDFPGLFPACAVTRSMSRSTEVEGTSEVDEVSLQDCEKSEDNLIQPDHTDLGLSEFFEDSPQPDNLQSSSDGGRNPDVTSFGSSPITRSKFIELQAGDPELMGVLVVMVEIQTDVVLVVVVVVIQTEGFLEVVIQTDGRPGAGSGDTNCLGPGGVCKRKYNEKVREDHGEAKQVNVAESRSAEAEVKAKEAEAKAKEADSENLGLCMQLGQSNPSNTDGLTPRSSFSHFDPARAARLMPTFSEETVEFFIAFERLATTLEWPIKFWHILLQQAFADSDANDYLCIKEEVPEAHRQRFRGLRKKAEQTHLEFARSKREIFSKWLHSKEVSEFDSLIELLLTEQFWRTINEEVAVYLLDREFSTIEEAAKHADGFVLRHERDKGRLTMVILCVTVFFCGKQHHKADFYWTRLQPNRESFAKDPDVGTFRPFLSQGTVEVDGVETPVTILRDSGCLQTLIKKGVVGARKTVKTSFWAPFGRVDLILGNGLLQQLEDDMPGVFPLCAVTRFMSVTNDHNVTPDISSVVNAVTGRVALIAAQEQDDSLRLLFDQVSDSANGSGPTTRYFKQNINTRLTTRDESCVAAARAESRATPRCPPIMAV